MQPNQISKLVVLSCLSALMISCGGEEGTCQTSIDCAEGQTCNVLTNLCEDDQAQTCTRPGTCTDGMICDVSTGDCVFAASCSTANPQPDACPYGQFCSGSNCAEVPVPAAACTNFADAAHEETWGTGKTGPVIHSITARATVVSSAFCGSGTPNRYRVDVEAYWGGGTFPGTDRDLETVLHLVDPEGNEINALNTVQNVTTSNDGKNVTFTVNYCRAATDAYSVGMHFTDGNEVCLTVAGL